jgi:hypothetical protein
VHCSFLSQLVRVTAQRAVEGAGNNTINQQSTTKYLVEKHKVLQQVSWLHGQLAELAAWAVGRTGCSSAAWYTVELVCSETWHAVQLVCSGTRMQ